MCGTPCQKVLWIQGGCRASRRGLKRALLNRLRKSLILEQLEAEKVLGDMLYTLTQFLLFPRCLLKTTILIFSLGKQKSEEGGREEGGSSGGEARPPVCPHIHPQSPPSWDTQRGVVENWGIALAPVSLAGLRWWGWE